MIKKLLMVMALCSGLLLFLMGILAFLGAGIDQQHESIVEESLPYSQELIWNMISQVEKTPEWNPLILSVDLLSTEPLVTWREHYQSGQSMSYGISYSEAPKLLKRKVIDEESPFKGDWTFELSSTDSGNTTIKITENGNIENTLIRFLAHRVMGIDSFQKQYITSLRNGAAKYVLSSESKINSPVDVN